MRPKGLSILIKLVGSRNRELPACGVLPEPLRHRVPPNYINVFIYLTNKEDWCILFSSHVTAIFQFLLSLHFLLICLTLCTGRGPNLPSTCLPFLLWLSLLSAINVYFLHSQLIISFFFFCINLHCFFYVLPTHPSHFMFSCRNLPHPPKPNAMS